MQRLVSTVRLGRIRLEGRRAWLSNVTPSKWAIAWQGYSTISSSDCSRGEQLKRLFDDPRLALHSPRTSKDTGGLLGVQIRRASDFQSLADRVIEDSNDLVRLIVQQGSGVPSGPSRIVDLMDVLSDKLCSVLDLAEFVRNVHPDQDYVQQADKACNVLANYMQRLNTMSGLYQARSLLICRGHEGHVTDLFLVTE